MALVAEKDRRIRAILTFASELESQLPTAVSSKSASTLLHDLEKNITTFPDKLSSSAASKCQEIDACGTTIWNLCTRLRRDYETEKPHDVPLILLLARVYAFLLLDCAHQSGKSTPGRLPRLMRTGLKAGKNCLDRKQADLALKVLERVSGYESLLKNSTTILEEEEDMESCRHMVAEYYVLRTALAWHKGQLDMAEHMFKLITIHPIFDPHTAESLSDVLYEMGKELLRKKDYKLASKWLERAYEMLSQQGLDNLSFDASELRVSIIQSLVTALIRLQSTQYINQARSLIILLENELGDKLIVLLLKLELLSVSTPEPFDSSAYSDVLHRIIRTVLLSDGNFKLMMFHIRKLNDKSPSLALKALDELLTLRILSAEECHEEWIGRILVTRLWFSTNQRDTLEACLALHDLFEVIANNLTTSLSSDAVIAAHTLLWKRIESNYAQAQYEAAERWCLLGLHKIFVTSGEINTARLSRKLLLCALAKKEVGHAMETFSAMSDSARNEPMSRFLMYKIAIRVGNNELAAECLQHISSAVKATQDPTLLYGCVLDAQQAGDKSQTLAGLQLVLDNSEYGAQSPIHLPSLLRLTITLMVALLDQNVKSRNSPDHYTVDKLCTAFEKGATAMKKSATSRPNDSEWTIDELEWFSKNSYNLAIKHLPTWDPRLSLRMLKACLNFMDQYPADLSGQATADLSLRKIFCSFSAATALISLARVEDQIEIQMQDYLTVRKHVNNFDVLLQEQLDGLSEYMQEDLTRKLSILLAFDFEAACRLKAWDDLPEIVLKSNICNNGQIYEIMADIILCSEASTEVRINVLKGIINEACGLDSMDLTRLAKYMRCLLQIALSGNTTMAEQLLRQIKEQAEGAAESEQPYPSEELDWVATKAFNHAVDLYCTGEDDGCRLWAGMALNIARYSNDNGQLERLLQDKLMSLKFGS